MTFKTKHLALLLFCFLLIHCSQEEGWKKKYPKPDNGTIIKMDMEEEEGDKKNKKKAWIDLMHQSTDDVDWRTIEADTRYNKHLQKTQLRRSFSRSNPEEEIIVEGKVIGKWVEKGSLNQAGSVFVTEYDPQSDQIYTISAGGSLFRGARDGSNWEVINHDLVFSESLLKLIKDDNEDQLLIAMMNDEPFYSYDMGKSWTKSSGIVVNGRSYSKDPLYIEGTKEIFLLNKPDWWSNINLYVSQDFGKTYESIMEFETSDFNNVAICNPHGSDELYLIEQISGVQSRFFKYNNETSGLELLQSNSPFSFGGNGRGNLDGAKVGDINRLFAFKDDQTLFISEDEGATWTEKGILPIRPWQVGLFVSKSNPDILLAGGVECFRSEDGGATWEKINEWWEYYSNVEFDLHADMMYFNEFYTSDGTGFILISNHGGLSASYDGTKSNRNISLSGLNVSQYYSVKSHPNEDNWIYAGSQDQGFQRANSTGDEVTNFEQVISGDYGHIVFTNDYSSLWTVYPGGWVTVYNNPKFGGYNYDWELNSDNESVWIPPLIPGPDPEENAILMAGGNANGGPGAHIIRLEQNQGSGITYTQYPFNFKSDSGGEVSAMAISPFDKDLWFVATTNGRIYKSADAGSNFESKATGSATSHYLYGSCILPSSINPDVVYFSGSGYSTDPVLVSYDAGETWEPMRDGLPPTMVFCMAANQDESLIFAATEAGPYVFVKEDQQWYDLSGISAPNQTYWSVEFLNNSNSARFGTYGRGIWDFQIVAPTTSISTNQGLFNVCNNTEFDFEINIGSGFSSEGVVLSTPDIPSGIQVIFEANPANPGSSIVASVIIDEIPSDLYKVKVQATDGTSIDDFAISIIVSNKPESAELIEPLDKNVEVSINPLFLWEDDGFVDSYLLEIALDMDFQEVIYSKEVSNNQFELEEIDLDFESSYFWRIMGSNNCGDNVSIVNSFTTFSTSAIEELELSEFKIYPNPVQSILHLEAKGIDSSEPIQIRLISSNGRLVWSDYITASNSSMNLNIDVSSYISGLYYLEIIQNQKIKNRKILIQD